MSPWERKRTPESPTTVVQRGKKRREREANADHDSPNGLVEGESESTRTTPSPVHDPRNLFQTDPFVGKHFEQNLTLKARIKQLEEENTHHQSRVTAVENRIAEQDLVIDGLIEQILRNGYCSGKYSSESGVDISNSTAGLPECAKDRLAMYPLAAERLHASLRSYVEKKQENSEEKWPHHPNCLSGVLNEAEEHSTILPRGPCLAYELVVSLSQIPYP